MYYYKFISACTQYRNSKYTEVQATNSLNVVECLAPPDISNYLGERYMRVFFSNRRGFLRALSFQLDFWSYHRSTNYQVTKPYKIICKRMIEVIVYWRVSRRWITIYNSTRPPSDGRQFFNTRCAYCFEIKPGQKHCLPCATISYIYIPALTMLLWKRAFTYTFYA